MDSSQVWGWGSRFGTLGLAGLWENGAEGVGVEFQGAGLSGYVW